MQKQCAPSLIRSASLSKTHCTSSSATEAQMHADRMLAAVCIHRERLFVLFWKNVVVSTTPRNQRVICTTKILSAKKHVHATTYIIFVAHYHSQHSCSNSDGGCLLASRCLVFKHGFFSSAACGGHVSRAVFRGRPGHTELLRRDALAETRHFGFGE